MSTDNVTPIRPPESGSKPKHPREPKAPKHDVSRLTFRTEPNDAEVSLILVALRCQFEAIKHVLDTEEDNTKASYLALGGAAIVQGLIERLDDEDGP